MKTSEEMLSRMERLVRRMSDMQCAGTSTGWKDWVPDYDEARSIVAELDDNLTDVERAKRMTKEHGLPDWVSSVVHDAIAKGRELERQRLNDYVDWNAVDIDADRANAR